MSTSRLDKTIEHDAMLADTVQPIKILGALTWPREAEARFLEAWRAGKPELPKVRLEPQDYSQQIETLESIQSRCDRGHPLDNLIFNTARSYASAARMLGAIGIHRRTPKVHTTMLMHNNRPIRLLPSQHGEKRIF